MLPEQPVGPVAPPSPLDLPPQALRVGLLVPMSGPQAGFGQAMIDAATLALSDVKADDVVLLPRDSGAEPPQSAAAARDLIETQAATVILGPIYGRNVPAVADVAHPREVPVIAFSNDTGALRPGVHLIGLAPEVQVERVVDFAVQHGKTRFAALLPYGPYGDRLAESYRRAVTRTGAELIDIARYSDPGSDAQDAVKRLSGGQPQPPFDSLLLAEAGERLRAIASLLPYYSIDQGEVQILGTALWQNQPVGRDQNLQGAWFAAPDRAAWETFARRFSALFGATPPALAGLAYDATALAAVLGRKGQLARELDSPDGFAGVNGLFRFDTRGGAEHALAIYGVAATGADLLDPAADRFTAGARPGEGVIRSNPLAAPTAPAIPATPAAPDGSVAPAGAAPATGSVAPAASGAAPTGLAPTGLAPTGLAPTGLAPAR
ncbi:penicillin-binding protein activator [Tistrella bauzanensis]|uniref:Penicillin-binding protein activator n=1 Tax=Tistrella bauzanensis TaxID=657419 RepID=A0ABQ1J772_9PROT|nr:penicillin-binding protein activator [Tistrella bauzanensis]